MNTIKHFTSEELTVGNLLDVVSDCSDDAIFLESNFTIDYTIELFGKDINNFEPIVGFYDDVYEIVSYSSFEKDHTSAKTLKQFKEFIDNGNIDLNLKISRDIEDGFKFSDFETIIYSKDVIILL